MLPATGVCVFFSNQTDDHYTPVFIGSCKETGQNKNKVI